MAWQAEAQGDPLIEKKNGGEKKIGNIKTTDRSPKFRFKTRRETYSLLPGNLNRERDFVGNSVG